MVAVQKMSDVTRRAWWRGRRAWRRAANAISNVVLRSSTLPRPQPSTDQGRASILEATEGLIARWANYRAETVDRTISQHDDMFEGDLQHYLFSGRWALEVISEAMLLARKMRFDNLLDVPCGYGRVTRHLVKFFPDSQIFVSEKDKAKQHFCASTFGSKELDLPLDFCGEPTRQFDLIFVGSLLTHLNERLSISALDYLLKSLSEGGLLIVTTHGRYATTLTSSPGRLEQKALQFMRKGFGYEGGSTYGSSRMAPSWVLRVLESMPDARVLGHKEGGWGWFQDVFVVEKATGWTWPRPGGWWIARQRTGR
jgi:SAM-dependent methyltransferase